MPEHSDSEAMSDFYDSPWSLCDQSISMEHDRLVKLVKSDPTATLVLALTAGLARLASITRIYESTMSSKYDAQYTPQAGSADRANMFVLAVSTLHEVVKLYIEAQKASAIPIPPENMFSDSCSIYKIVAEDLFSDKAYKNMDAFHRVLEYTRNKLGHHFDAKYIANSLLQIKQPFPPIQLAIRQQPSFKRISYIYPLAGEIVAHTLACVIPNDTNSSNKDSIEHIGNTVFSLLNIMLETVNDSVINFWREHGADIRNHDSKSDS